MLIGLIFQTVKQQALLMAGSDPFELNYPDKQPNHNGFIAIASLTIPIQIPDTENMIGLTAEAALCPAFGWEFLL